MSVSRWATFDCYGTLVDWEQGMGRAIDQLAPGRSGALLAAYYELEPEVEAEVPFRSYRRVLEETLKRAAARVGVRLPAGSEHILAETLPNWPVFSDVEPALLALRSGGWKLAILSNVDRDLIAGTLEHLRVPFDEVVTAQEVRAYKPAPAHFLKFQERLKISPANWIHVARSWLHDVQPCSELGLRCVWINRGREVRDTSRAAGVLLDLTALPVTLERLMRGAKADTTSTRPGGR